MWICQGRFPVLAAKAIRVPSGDQRGSATLSGSRGQPARIPARRARPPELALGEGGVGDPAAVAGEVDALGRDAQERDEAALPRLVADERGVLGRRVHDAPLARAPHRAPQRRARERQQQDRGRHRPGRPGARRCRGRAVAAGCRRDGAQRGLQCQRQVVRGMEALLGLLAQAALDHAHERRRQRRLELVEGPRLAPEDRGHRLRRGLLVERPPAPQHLVEHHAAREDVGARVERLAPHLLRRHVGGRAADRRVLRGVEAGEALVFGRRARPARGRGS